MLSQTQYGCIWMPSTDPNWSLSHPSLQEADVTRHLLLHNPSSLVLLLLDDVLRHGQHCLGCNNDTQQPSSPATAPPRLSHAREASKDGVGHTLRQHIQGTGNVVDTFHAGNRELLQVGQSQKLKGVLGEGII